MTKEDYAQMLENDLETAIAARSAPNLGRHSHSAADFRIL